MAAGIWATGSGIGDANIAVAARTIQVALDTSVKNLDFIGHPVVMDLMARDEGLGQLMGALGVSVSLAAIGQETLAATAEGTEAGATNFSTSNSTTITPARRELTRDVSDFAASMQESMLRGDLAPSVVATLVLDGMRAWANTVSSLLLATATSASNNIGTTGTALTWQEVHEGVIDFKDRGAGNGPALGLISAKGAKDLIADGLSLGGAVAQMGSTQTFAQGVSGASYIGRHFDVDWYIPTGVATSGGDTVGMVLTPGSHLMKTQRVPLPANADRLVDAGFFTQELRRPGGGVNRVSTACYNALGILEQGRLASVTYVT
jgi:hypothetical protein